MHLLEHSMASNLDRRRFLKTSAVAPSALSAIATSSLARGTTSPNEKIAIGVMGLGRGSALAAAIAAQPDAEVAYLCDVDSRRLASVVDAIGGKQSRKPKAVGDFRKILDDPAVDALAIAAPDHWHAPATILTCAAGKHVYVEKPCCHNPHEGELQIAAARKHDRVVQVGMQRRSWPAVMEAVEKLRGGAIGRVLYSRGWYANHRPTIGKGKPTSPPPELDYSLWQGPAPERPFKDNYLHYTWHGFWNWGTGELGNNGVHALDMCRWGLGVDFPTRVTSGGGKYRYDDDQETPDTHTVTFDFGDKTIFWEGLSWSPRGMEGEGFGVTFHGERGTMVINSTGYVAYDLMNKEIAKASGKAGDEIHMADFVASIRAGRRPHADIEEGHKSALLCHLGNIAYRVGRVLHCDANSGRILNDDEATRLWTREYRPGWEPKV
jgi:predicted dehydrogenase